MEIEDISDNNFKITTIGEIPNDWKLAQLKDISSIIDGDRSSNYPSGEDFVENGIPFLGTKNISSSIFNFDEIRYITEDKFSSIKKGKVIKDDLIITMRGNGVGSVARFLGDPYNTALINAQMLIIRPKSINSNYLWTVLNGYIIPRYLKKITSGSAQPQLTKKDVELIPIILPTSLEQSRISSIINLWNQAINLIERLIIQKKMQKKGLIHSLLNGEVRLPGFTQEWKTFKLGELVEFKKGVGLNKDKIRDKGKYKCILYGELYTKYDVVIKNVDSYVNELEGIFSEENDILIPASTTTKAIDLATASAVTENDILIGGDINILRQKKKVYNNDYLAYYLKFIKKKELATFGQGTTIIHLYGKELRKLDITIPTLEEQKKISNILGKANKEIELLYEQFQRLKEQKKALEQQLLTGKIRVKV